MTRPNPRAFSLIELLVVIVIIALLLGIIIPAISAAQMRGAVAKCVSNAGQIALAMNAYVADNRGYYPAGTSAAPWNDSRPGRWTVVGGGTSSTDTDAARTNDANSRALGRYVKNNPFIAECPLDNGDSLDGAPSSRFKASGSSYMYPDYGVASPTSYANMYVYAGVVAIEGRRATEFASPIRKAVIYDTPMATNRPATTGANQWHNNADPLKGGMGFADGHAEERARKISGWPSGISSSDGSAANATVAQIDALMTMKEQYY